MKIDRNKIYEKFSGRCAYCGHAINIKQMHVDHIIPKRNFLQAVHNKWKIPEFLKHLKEDDINHPDNLFPACPVCNRWKTTFDIETFRSEISQQVHRLNQRSANYRMARRYGKVFEMDDAPVVFFFETYIPISKLLKKS